MIPKDARIFPLTPGTKIPQPNSRGHLDAREFEFWSNDDVNLPFRDYGIALDGQFLVVDIDDSTKVAPGWFIKFERAAKDTWSQLTKRGSHFLFRVPEGFVGTNVKIPGKPGAGDIKTRGYIVGPGSIIYGDEEDSRRTSFEYSMANNTDPIDAPEWLLEMCVDRRPGPGVLGVEAVGSQLQIKEGEGRNQFLTRAAGSLRGLGLGVDQTKEILRSINVRACEPPVSEMELRATIDKSIEKWSQGRIERTELDGPFNREGWINAGDIPIVRPPISWWEWGFVPKGVLTLVYGRGGIGKSTLAAWLAAKVSTSGGRFGVVTREDPFDLFANRARLSGAVPSLIWSPKSGDMLFPRDGEKLHDIVKEMKLDFLYFDSIYDHFEPSKDLHAGERARQSLSPLAKIASDTGCTIMGTFHTNKTGKFMGSTEMENVARVLLEASRGDTPDSPLTISVEKSNFKKPDFNLQFTIEESKIVDPESGEVQQEEKQDGTFGEAMLSFARKQENVAVGAINVDSISPVSSLASDYIVEYLGNMPGGRGKSMEVQEYVTSKGISERSYDRAIKGLIESKEIETEGPVQNRYYIIGD